MSEAIVEPGAESQEPSEPNVTETPQGEPADLGDAGKKAIAAERAAAKAEKQRADSLAAELKSIKDAQLSDVERANQAAADSAAELARLRSENIRNSVALAKGVPADLIEFLTGETEEEVTAKADLLVSRLNTPKTPKADPSQGPAGVAPKARSTAQQFADAWKD